VFILYTNELDCKTVKFLSGIKENTGKTTCDALFPIIRPCFHIVVATADTDINVLETSSIKLIKFHVLSFVLITIYFDVDGVLDTDS
jgi:hypothetical protein